MNSHLHEYRFDSKSSNKHKHTISGYTENSIGVNSFHFHFFFGTSSYDGHSHYYSGITGLPIKTENGHVHKIEGVFELNNQHEHGIRNFTFEDISYISGNLIKKAIL